MIVGVPKEIRPNERRVALVPESVNKLTTAGIDVLVQAGAGENAFFLDDAYAAAGATISSDAQTLFASAGVVVKVQRPDSNGGQPSPEIAMMRSGAVLISFLQPFNTDIWVYDPYLSRDIAEIVGFTQTSLDNILSKCDVIVCLAPLTPGTKGMIGKRELDLIRPGSAFVNVSRGAIVDSNALIERLKKGDITAGIEAFDPEPIPSDSEIIHLPNVFLSPHFSGITGDDYPHFFNLMVDELHRFFQGHETWFNLTPQSLANRKGD